jgi:hypothetical protein
LVYPLAELVELLLLGVGPSPPSFVLLRTSELDRFILFSAVAAMAALALFAVSVVTVTPVASVALAA